MMMSSAKKWRFFYLLAGFLLFASFLCVDSAYSSWRRSAESDPMEGMWSAPIVPKHRAAISYMDTDRAVKTFRGQNADIESDLAPYATQSVYTTSPSALGSLTGGDGSRPYVVTAAAGTISRDVMLSNDFYGATKFTGVPESVLCTAYLTMTDSDGKNTAVWLEMTDINGRIGQVQLEGAPKPVYRYYFNGDGSKTKAPEIDQNVASDLVAFDWNKDGYADYVLSYVHNPSGNNEYADTKVALVYIDGKSLYDALRGTGSPIFSSHTSIPFGDKQYTAGGKTDVKPAGSCRIAAGDIDGDGLAEIAVYNTMAGGKRDDGNDDNQFNVFRLSVNDTTKKAAFSNIYTRTALGGSYLQNDSVGVAMGDIDGDGLDEICALYAQTNLLYEVANVYLSIFKWDTLAKQLVSKREKAAFAETYKVNERSEISMAPIDASIADLDGDGCGELVWVSLKGKDRIRLWVHKWGTGGDLSNTGGARDYDIAGMGGWILNPDVARFSMATGLFQYPDGAANIKLPRQIAVSHMGGSSTGNDSKCNLDWGIFSWNSTDGLKLLGKGLATDLAKVDNVIPKVAAVDLNRESMVLGDPARLTVQDNIEPLFVTQAPPKHWDVVSGEFAGANPPDASGNSRVDAFFNLSGYATTIDSNSSQETITMTTDTSTGTFGAQASYSRSQTFVFKDAVPLLDIGAQYAMDKVNETTSGQTWKATSAFSATAETDDQLYYRCNDYEIWRYPVLYPESQRTVQVTDEKGNAVSAQNFLQFVIPKTVETVFAPAEGRRVSWYEPLHDNLNLFTYPRKLEDIEGFPAGRSAKSPSDPWLDTNGLVIVKGNKQQIGNPDKSSFTAELSQSSHSSELSSLSQTVGGNASKNFGFRGLLANAFTPGKANTINVSLEGDYSWQTATTTTADASRMKGFTVSWPGAKNYQNAGGFSLEDQQFESDIAIYTEDSGAFCIGYTVNTLKSARSRLWGEGSPLRTLPDPGLLLPFRYLTSGAENTTVDRLLIRGLLFEGKEIAFDLEKLPGKALPIKTPVTGRFRVINYSFVGAREPLSASIYYQPLGSSEITPDLSKAELVATVPVTPISGREEYADNDNWEEVAFDWTTPATTGNGYLHVKLDYNGQELSVANNNGYALVGCYDPADFAALESSSARYASCGAAASLDLAIVSTKVRALNDDGTTGEELDISALPNDREVEVECTVRLSATGNSSVKALPLVRLYLFGGGGSILAAKELPALRVGDEWTLRLTGNLAEAAKAGVDTMRLVASSPYLKVLDEADPVNNAVTLKLATGTPTPKPSGGSSSSCAAVPWPIAAIALTLTVGPSLRRRKR